MHTSTSCVHGPAETLRVAACAHRHVIQRASQLGFEPVGHVACTPYFHRKRQNSLCEFDILFVQVG